MVRRSDEINTVVKEAMFGGQGHSKMRPILNGAEEMYNKGRVFSHVILEKGCEVGWHIHNGDGEAYYIIRGKGVYNDNGTLVEVRPGDVTFVDAGEGHSMINNEDEPLEMIALVLYK